MKFWIVQLVVFTVLLLGVQGIKYLKFSMYCGGYMERASNANSVELARDNMVMVLNYLETHNMTNGTTTVLWPDPTMDVGYWYKNMRAAYTELCLVPSNASMLEKSNVLMKLRETLITHGKNGEQLVVPARISFYPNNVLFVSLALLHIMDCMVVLLIACCYYRIWD